MKLLLTVEDDPDLRALVRLQFARDPDFELDGEAADASTALEAAAAYLPDLIVLDHHLEGETSGLDAAVALKAAAPAAKVILFSASERIRVLAVDNAAVDAFLLKTDIRRLVPLGRELLGLG